MGKSSRAGTLTARGAAMLGLPQGTPVAVGGVDAHVGLPGIGLTEPGSLLMLVGTSCCHLLTDTADIPVPGISGVDGPTYLRFLIALGYSIEVLMADGQRLACGDDVEQVMNAYTRSGVDHIDFVATAAS